MKFEKLKLTSEYICKIDNDNNREAKHALYLMVGGSIIHALVGVAMIMCYFLNLGKSNTGINAKVIVCATGFIRFFCYTSGLLVTYVFCKNKIINFIYTKLIKTLMYVIYVPWSIYCIFRFFSPENDTKETAGFLYSGMFYLMIEGIILQLAIALLLIFVSILLVLILYLSRVHNAIKHEDYIRNLKLHKYIQYIDILRLTQRKYDCTETCHICAEKYTLEDRVKSLECHEIHYFHKDCLKEWINTESTCPICKEEVGDVDIEYTDNPDDSYHHKEGTISYGSMDSETRDKVEHNPNEVALLNREKIINKEM